MASSATDWGKLTVVNLRAELKQRDLSTAGRKEELVQRLVEYEENGGEDGAAVEGGGDTEMADESKGDEPKDEEPKGEEEEKAEPEANTETAPEVAPTSAEPEPTPSNTQEATPMPPPASTVPMSEVLQDEQKRKRRSVTPPPSLHNEATARKRQRVEDQDMSDQPSEVPSEAASKSASAAPEPRPDEDTDMGVDKAPAPSGDVDMDDAADVGGGSAPSIHPATTALYICHLMRPLRPSALEDHVADLAARNDNVAANSVLVNSFLDPIKTHAFVVFSTISAAARVRSALHGQIWPDESNRRPLWVDFVPSESVQRWIDEEEANDGSKKAGSRSSAKKWEVVYSEEENGDVATTLREVGSDTPILGRILYDPSNPPGAFGGAGPDRDSGRMLDADDLPARRSPPPFDAPRGPKGSAEARFGGGNPDNENRFGPHDVPPPPPREKRQRERGGAWAPLDDDVRTTRTNPPLNYRLVVPDLVRRRQDSIALHTRPRNNNGKNGGRPKSPSPGPGRNGESHYTKTHNRYTFEQGDQLVDRGPEQFDGIRPPHRERERRQQRRNGGAGGGGGGRLGGGGGGGGGGSGGGGRRRRRNRRGAGGRGYDDYRPDRDGRLGDRGGDRKDWDDRRDRDRGQSGRNDRGGGNGRGGRDEREGRLGGFDNSRW